MTAIQKATFVLQMLSLVALAASIVVSVRGHRRQRRAIASAHEALRRQDEAWDEFFTRWGIEDPRGRE